MTTISVSEPTTIGLSERAHGLLKRLVEDKRNGQFAEMADAYRFAIGLALAHRVIPGEVPTPRTTIFNVGTLDPDKAIYGAVRTLVDTGSMSVYRWAERLAEWGVEELYRKFELGKVDVADILSEVEGTT